MNLIPCPIKNYNIFITTITFLTTAKYFQTYGGENCLKFASISLIFDYVFGAQD